MTYLGVRWLGLAAILSVIGAVACLVVARLEQLSWLTWAGLALAIVGSIAGMLYGGYVSAMTSGDDQS